MTFGIGTPSSPEQNLWILREIVLVLLAPVAVLALTHLLSVVSGWRGLEVAHPAPEPFNGDDVRSWRTVVVGLPYVRVADLGVGRAGIYLAIPLLRWTHKPILMKWSEVRLSSGQSWGGTSVVITSTRAPGRGASLRRADFDACLALNGIDEPSLPVSVR